MSQEAEAKLFDIGTTSIRLVRVGNIVHIVFSGSLEAKFLYKELAERYKQAEEKLRGE